VGPSARRGGTQARSNEAAIPIDYVTVGLGGEHWGWVWWRRERNWDPTFSSSSKQVKALPRRTAQSIVGLIGNH
jgi:hypothetical protein